MSLYFGGSEGVVFRDYSTYTVVTWADANFARVFGLQPLAGRLYSESEAYRAALVSEVFALDNFRGAEAALGKTLHIENEAVEIVAFCPAVLTLGAALVASCKAIHIDPMRALRAE